MPSHSRLIILDFDHTIFNTTTFTSRLRERLSDFGISRAEFDRHQKHLKACCRAIDIDQFVTLLSYPDKAALHRAIHEVIRTYAAECLFSDVRPFIDQQHVTADILIVTHGDTELQSEKIAHSHLPGYVEHHISLEPKVEVIKKFIPLYETIYYIDDKAENIDPVKTAFPSVQTYFLQRPEDHPYADRASECACADHIIRGLSEVVL